MKYELSGIRAFGKIVGNGSEKQEQQTRASCYLIPPSKEGQAFSIDTIPVIL
jgi:hypothetical protein